MQRSRLSSLDLRAFFRTCHFFLIDEMTLDSWTAYQKFLLLSEQTDFAFFIRQLKKLPPEIKKEIIDGLSNSQIESKLWLLQAMQDVLPPGMMSVHVLGSWFGLLCRMIEWTMGERIHFVRNYDLDSRWSSVAASLNEPHFKGHIFVTRDMNAIDYSQFEITPSTVLINTSCEHLEDFDGWYNRLVPGNLLVLQGNNFEEPEDHKHIWKTYEDFRNSTPMETVLYEGQLKLFKYTRFMRIGVR